MKRLNQDAILKLHDAIVSADLVESRKALLAGIDPRFVAGIQGAATPRDRILHDLDALNSVGALADGSVPLATWLKNASALAAPRKESAIFSAELERIGDESRSVYASANADLSFESDGKNAHVWGGIPPEIRTQIEGWRRANAVGNAFAALSISLSVGCTVWGFYLSDMKHEPQAYAQWRVVFAGELAIVIISWIGIARYGFQKVSASQQATSVPSEKPQWWEALDATREMRAGEMVQLIGSLWASKPSVDLVATVTTISVFVLAVGTPLLRYFFFGSVP